MPQKPDCNHFMLARIPESSSTSGSSDGLRPILKCDQCGAILYEKVAQIPRAKGQSPAFAGL